MRRAAHRQRPTTALLIDRLRRMGAPTGAEDYLVPNLRGARLNRQRVGQIVSAAAELRRTYISIAWLANNFDVKWVMEQVGHADSKMTMDVYAQLEQRVDRSHGTSFDRLVRTARKQVADLPIGPDSAPNGRRFGDEAENRPNTSVPHRMSRGEPRSRQSGLPGRQRRTHSSRPPGRSHEAPCRCQ
jgi:hypothetical protein